MNTNQISCLKCERFCISSNNLCSFCDLVQKPAGNCKICGCSDEFVNHTFLNLCKSCYCKYCDCSDNINNSIVKDLKALKKILIYFTGKPEIQKTFLTPQTGRMLDSYKKNPSNPAFVADMLVQSEKNFYLNPCDDGYFDV